MLGLFNSDVVLKTCPNIKNGLIVVSDVTARLNPTGSQQPLKARSGQN